MPASRRHASSNKPSSTKKLSTLPLSHIRIIAGKYRRRLVGFITADGLRPTPDRLRETLFNWLNDALPNATVLDCCAGSGILGLEALSRGASHVTLIEPNRQQCDVIRQTILQLAINPQKITVLPTTAQQALPQLSQPFDVIFLDPPYSLDLWSPLLTLLQVQGSIHAQTLIYIEADRPHHQLNLPPLLCVKQTQVGQIYAGVYRPDTLLAAEIQQ